MVTNVQACPISIIIALNLFFFSMYSVVIYFFTMSLLTYKVIMVVLLIIRIVDDEASTYFLFLNTERCSFSIIHRVS